ncbi:MAG: hypothetical protein J6M02_05690 [Clostridia bacterium]|nr:hypothetical protein [Clostridia bacterium]
MKKLFSYQELKLIALICMFIDHVGILTNNSFFRIIGRLSFPIYAFLLVNGFFYTRNIRKYSMKMLLFAIVSEVPFDLFMFGKLDFVKQNIFFTLFLGLIAVQFMNKSKRNISAVIFLMLMAEAFNVDYGMKGILVILTFYYFRNKTLKITLVLLVLLFFSMNGLGSFGVLSLFFINLYAPNKKIKWKFSNFFYIFYPVHLFVLYLVR